MTDFTDDEKRAFGKLLATQAQELGQSGVAPDLVIFGLMKQQQQQENADFDWITYKAVASSHVAFEAAYNKTPSTPELTGYMGYVAQFGQKPTWEQLVAFMGSVEAAGGVSRKM